MFLTLTCAYVDHNLIFLKHFAADESQSLAAIFRNEEGATDGVHVLLVPRRKYHAMGIYSVSDPLSPYIQHQHT